MSPAAKRCVAAVQDGRPPPPAVLELSGTDQDATFVLAPGHAPGLLAEFAGMRGALVRDRPRPGGGREHAAYPRFAPIPSACPNWTTSSPHNDVWVEPGTLVLLQEIREQHARRRARVAVRRQPTPHWPCTASAVS